MVRGEDVADFIDKLLAESDETPALGTLLALGLIQIIINHGEERGTSMTKRMDEASC